MQGVASARSRASRLPDTLRDLWVFFRAWRAHPGEVGAILPSGRALARAITAEVEPERGPVLELGCGTGVFTRKILERGVSASDLTLVELDPLFAGRLRARFPQARVLCMDACELHRMAGDRAKSAGIAICGLPLLNMSPKKKLGILRGVFSVLRSDGALYLFSYGPACPVSRRLLDRLGLRARNSHTVLLNMPPARVWKITRRGNLQCPSASHPPVKPARRNP